MGGVTKIVLVGIFAALGVATYWYIQAESTTKKAYVIASDYRDFWLWPGNRIPANISAIDNLYILQGEFLAKNLPNEIQLAGISPSRVNAKKLWLVFRVEKIEWNVAIAIAINRRIAVWEHYGNTVAGIQIDFDARSEALADYAGLLSRVRQQLPMNYQLSVTGLLDWSNGAYDSGLRDINLTVDELVFQTYQGRLTIPDYAVYLQRISRLETAFKIGLVENGSWQPSAEILEELEKNRNFLGFVVFLQSRASPKN